MSDVFFADKREHFHFNVFNKLDILLEKINYKNIIKKNELVAIKIHFGEKGNTGYLNPLYAAHIVRKVKEIGAKPFLTDGSTIYKGTRTDAVSHIETAIKNGFNYATCEAPIIIADGLKGTNCVKINVNGEIVEVGAEVYNADALICLTHFKAHELAGIGGALKNIGMGLASKKGKLKMHTTVSPFVKEKYCIFCKVCFSACPANAISEKNKKAFINSNKCVGCGQCILSCAQKAITINWNIEPIKMMDLMITYVKGILSNKINKMFFINFIEKVSPECDCYGHSDIPIVPDVGVLASIDPVAIDKASADLVNLQEGNKNTSLKSNFKSGEDKFLALHPNCNWMFQIKKAEELGIGSSKYNLIKISEK
ncbi:MAG TPA: DUF362 domain-containing protein [bacterium]|nr:DUF362 domain-containing protein [bacterium]HOL46589.1 DUF362 domain-containing protein [bacterium]HPQ17840.1 DUF362 domain-containing protein [bacterium]